LIQRQAHQESNATGGQFSSDFSSKFYQKWMFASRGEQLQKNLLLATK
jgi:hypothetical protein